jgi:hypothetical protein
VGAAQAESWSVILKRRDGRDQLPAGAIEVPQASSGAHRTPLIAGGWALGPQGPLTEAIVLVDGRWATSAKLDFPREDIAVRYPDVPGAERAGWSAMIDVRGVVGTTAELRLLGHTFAGEWAELDRSEVRVDEPGALSERRGAVFTIAQNEIRFLPLWLGHYRRDFDAADIYVLDHGSTDGSTESLDQHCNVVAVHREKSFDHMWLKGTVEDFQAFLLRSYETVLFAEVDEFVVADPDRYAGLGAYIEGLREPAACCTGYSVVQHPEEPPLRFDAPVLPQRRYWHRSPKYSKRLIGRIPLAWNIGFHTEFNAPAIQPDPHLYLIHLHRVDYEYCLERHRSSASRPWPEEDLQWNLGWHQRVVEPDEFRHWFFHGDDLGDPERERIPDRLRAVL